MLVRDYMTRHPITIGPKEPLIEAQKIMAENKIKHLLVVDDGGKLLGILTPSRFSFTPDKLNSLDMWEITRYLNELDVSGLMIKASRTQTVDPDTTLEEAADLIVTKGVTGLPVVENGIVVGIITRGDLLFELRNLLGAKERGWRVTLLTPDRPGIFAKLIQAIHGQGWGIMAMGTVRAPRNPDHWELLVKVSRCEDKQALLDVIGGIEDHKILDIRATSLQPPT